ncbi:hypothetical protein EOS_35675 [Caballeronia mineralivorans PML1(12)]|uniref:Uncharacterized protein n=1 Tax=Caballeronia mineralivorans PML1(12) TaxID=908627 RepID=A0A0J1CL69_9BURK|nr:hypothetical protein [Caballeronia mineralivorans]KLU21510.1 hypothetical protein EOS_35675 [Caballeronia mineralivorans PML1(12)]
MIKINSVAELKTSLENDGMARLANGKPFSFRGVSITIAAMPDSRTGKPGPDSGIGIYTESSAWQRFLQRFFPRYTNEAKLTDFKSTVHEWAKGLLENTGDLAAVPDETRNEKISELKNSVALYFATASLGQSTALLHTGARQEAFRALSTLAGDYLTASADDQDKSMAVFQDLLSYCKKTQPTQMESIEALRVAGHAYLSASLDAKEELSAMADIQGWDEARLGEIESIFNRIAQSATRIRACVSLLNEDIEDTVFNSPQTEHSLAEFWIGELKSEFAKVNTIAQPLLMDMCVAAIMSATKFNPGEESSSLRVTIASQLFERCAATQDNSRALAAIKLEKHRAVTAYRTAAIPFNNRTATHAWTGRLDVDTTPESYNGL